MKLLWCWRCKMEVPMLDEEEFAIASKLYSNGFRLSNGGDISGRFKPLLDYYKQVTGWDETVPNAIMHHRIETYGPACENCGKPYRTKQASFCAACGHGRISQTESIHRNTMEEKANNIATVYFISGLGIDERAFKKIIAPIGMKAVYLPWVKHDDSERLSDYCIKIAALVDTSEPFALVGFSFGGIIAVELGKLLSPVKTIIISSCTVRNELPFYLRFLGRIKLYKIVPAASMNKTSGITNWFNNVQNKEDRDLINQIIMESNPHFVKWAIDKILNWPNKERPAKLYQIHGTSDRLFPCSNVHADKTIKNAGHFMVLTHAKEINQILQEQLTV